jgi:threonine dehydratase
MSQWPTPTAADIAAAATRIAGIAWHTPLLRSAWLSDLTGADVWLKLELAQQTGSFKIRGAANALAALRERRPDIRGVVTASAGNHGLAVAWVARRLGISVRVYVPKHAPDAKRHALTQLGAELVEMPTYEDAETAAHAHASKTGVPFVSPYDDADVVAGAATVAREMFADQPELDDVIAPIGGGGLLSGIAIVARARAHRTRVIGAEAAASPAFTGALAAGHIVTVRVEPTLADGLAGNMEPDSQTFDLVRDLADRVMLVQESCIKRAMRELIVHERLIVEGASATSVGLLLQRGDEAPDVRGRRVGIVLTGRNVDAATVSAVLQA